MIDMHFSRLFIIILIVLQFTSSLASSASSINTSTSKSKLSSNSSTSTVTNKPKTSFTRHFAKIFTPFKKLFSSKPKNNTQPSESWTPASNQDLFNKNESIDQLISNSSTITVGSTAIPDLANSIPTNELDLSINNTLNLIDLNVSDSIDQFDEINLKQNHNQINESSTLHHLDEINPKLENNNSINEPSLLHLEKESNLVYLVKKSIMNQSSFQNLIDELNLKPVDNYSVNESSISNHHEETIITSDNISDNKISTQESIILTTTEVSDITTQVYRRKQQKLKDDEIRICFEIEELNVRKCYIQIPTTSHFIYSRNYCETHFSKGRLITINTVEEQSFLILNNVYYFWTAFKVKLGLTTDLMPYIAAIQPIYKQTNSSIELIKKLDFNQNLIVSSAELNELISNNKWTTFASNDQDAYELNDIRIDESAKSPIILIAPKLYCLEASLNFENGLPLYKWMIKDCEHEISSFVCELTEPIVEEYTGSEYTNNGRKSNNMIGNKITEDKSENSKSNQLETTTNIAIADEEVSRLVNQFLNEPINRTREQFKPIRLTTEPSDEDSFETESSDEFKVILSDLLKEEMNKITKPVIIISTTLNPSIVESTTELINETTSRSIEQTTKETITESTTIIINSIEPKIESETTTLSPSTTTTIVENNQSTDNNKCDNEKNHLVYQFLFAFNIAFKTISKLIVDTFDDLFKKRTLSEWDLKTIVKITIVSLITLISIGLIVISLLIICRFFYRISTRKRRLLLDQLVNDQRNKKEFTVAIDKKFDDDDSCYYSIPHNRNIYVSNPQMIRKVHNIEKYKSIPKENFY